VQLKKNNLFPESIIQQILDKSTLENAEKQVKWAELENIHVLDLHTPLYPELLKQIFAPPPVLFAKGDTTVLSRHCMSVVGTRQPTTYGKNVVELIVKELVKHSLCIVSGLASGIDTFAHETCINNNGTTIAVLGCGLDKMYPASNKTLAKRIAEKGVILSEFPLGTSPLAYNFPRRNRIISGLSAGTLVIEAGKKSGSLITAHYALQQGREVFAIPGSIFSEKSAGTFDLIKQGALPVREITDILENIEVIKNSCCSPQTIPRTLSIPINLLSSEEQNILNLLSDIPKRIDQIVEESSKPVTTLFSLLLNMELKGVIQQIAGGQYIRC